MKADKDSEADEGGDVRLTNGERRAMLEDIARIGLAWGRDAETSFSAHPDRAASAEPVSVQERIALLLRCWSEIAAGLNGMARQPDTRLVRQIVSVPMARAQGGPESASRIARKPGALQTWLCSQPGANLPSVSAPPMLDERRLASSLDTPANRFVVTLLERFALEAESLAPLAAFCGESDQSAQLERAARQARRWRQTSPLGNLAPLREADCADWCGGNPTLRHNSTYAALVRGWQTLHSRLYFDWTVLSWLRLPALETWRLYEIWCFLKVAEALVNLGWRRTDAPGIRVRNRALRLELATARDSRLRFRRNKDVLDLLYQPVFSSANQRRQPVAALPDNAALEPRRFVSTSHLMQPDIALVWRGTSGTQLFLLDPKFRRYSEPGDEQTDVNKMHTYRDAIVAANPLPPSKEGAPPSAVSGAWCVFAGEPLNFVPLSVSSRPLAPDIALRTYPHPTPEQPFGTAPVGAVRLRPDEPDGLNFLGRLLAHWLNEALNEE